HARVRGFDLGERLRSDRVVGAAVADPERDRAPDEDERAHDGQDHPARGLHGIVLQCGRRQLIIGDMSKAYPPVEYSEYLKLDRLLSSQEPKSAAYGKPAHDEMLFIVVHQAYELWFKQILHELDSVRALFRQDSVDERSIGTAVLRLQRVVAIQ